MVLRRRTIQIVLLSAAIAGGGVLYPGSGLRAQSDGETTEAEPTADPEDGEQADGPTQTSGSDSDASEEDAGGESEDSGAAGGESTPRTPDAASAVPSMDDEDDAEGGEGDKGGEDMPDNAPAAPSVPDTVGEQKAKQIKRFRQAYKRYAAEIKDYQSTIDSIVSAEYSKRRSRVNAKYDRRAEQLQQAERERRLAAIEKFQQFLDRHPDRPKYTPDAMFRLAELYFEKENDEYLQADARYQRESKRYQQGRRPSPPEPPQKDYTETISVFSKLVREWPDYRLLDGAYYLLAYCNQQMGNARKARDLFAELIVKRPNSEFVPEAWVRIGEYHFDRSDNPGEIALAKEAYEQAMKYKGSRFYDKALYKLAWANYRLDKFDEAIRDFEQLVEYSDRQKEKTGRSGSVLRAEAIKYIAVSLAEEDWDLDRSVDEDFGLPRIKKYLDEGKAYEREVLVELVDYLFENERFEVAVNVIRYTLGEFPMHRRNPKLHEKLIIALMRPPQKLDAAFDERSALLETYGPDSKWYAHQKQEGNEEAIEFGDDLVRENLIQAATWYHEQAQKTLQKAKVKRDPEILAEARQRYAKAAKAYRQFLRRYPNDKDIYKWNFYYAESLYYSAQYQEAYRQYKVVRELDLKDNKFQATAAFNAVKSLEFQMKKAVKEGKLPDFVVPDGNKEDARETAQKNQNKNQGGDRTQQKVAIDKRPVPELVEKYITAMDRFVVLRLDYEGQKALDAKFAFNAAKIYYDFKHFDTARKRFGWIVEHYPDREEAFLAGSLILDTYRQEKKYDKLAKWATKLEGVIKGERAEKIKSEVREIKLGARFKEAQKLFSANKYEKAAKKYEELVDEAPDHKNAPLALNNAAIAYENIKKYESAIRLYQKLFENHPDSPLAGYALYRVGVNSERFFDFDNAIRKYKLFYEYEFDDTPEGETPTKLAEMGFDVAEKKALALLNTAVLAENLQRYLEAARRYEKFVAEYPERDEAPQAQWQAVEAWKKADEKEKMVDAIEAYIEDYGDKKDRSDRVLEGMMRIAEWHEQKGEDEEAKETYKAILEEFKKRGLAKGSNAAYYAAKAQFQLAEYEYKEWRDIKIDGSLAQQKKKLQEKVKVQKKVSNEFKEVFQFRNLEWTLASGYRLGSLFQGFAEALYNVPIPFEQGTPQYNQYMIRLEDIAREFENRAVDRYAKTIKKAREAKIVNEWTKKTLNELNAFRPNEYPLYKEARLAKQKEMVTGRSLLSKEPNIQVEDGGFEEGSGEGPGGPSGADGNKSPDDSSNGTGGGASNEAGSDSRNEQSAKLSNQGEDAS